MKLNRYTYEIERLTIIPTTISKIGTYSQAFVFDIRWSEYENSEFPSLKIRPYLKTWGLWSFSLLDLSERRYRDTPESTYEWWVEDK